jgi:hypothetical protein
MGHSEATTSPLTEIPATQESPKLAQDLEKAENTEKSD